MYILSYNVRLDMTYFWDTFEQWGFQYLRKKIQKNTEF